MRLITQHWSKFGSKFGVLAVLYLLAFASLGTLANVQIDALQNQVQFVGERTGNVK